MIKIKKNFFDNDLIEELSTLAIKSYKSNKLRTNFSSWNDGIVQHSSVVLIYDKDLIFGKLPCLPMGICFGSLCNLYVFNDGLSGYRKSFSLLTFCLEVVN